MGAFDCFSADVTHFSSWFVCLGAGADWLLPDQGVLP